MTLFENRPRHALTLSITRPVAGAEIYELSLLDSKGQLATGEFTLDEDRPLGSGTWRNFLESYLRGDASPASLHDFGKDIYRILLTEQSNLFDAWLDAYGAASGHPLDLTLDLHPHTEEFARLPLELLHDETGFLFARPGSQLRRTYQNIPQRAFLKPAEPRVLFVWASPFPGAQGAFDPEPHWKTLRTHFGDRVKRLDQATIQDLGKTLQEATKAGRAFDYVHLLAHGFRHASRGGLCLQGATPLLMDQVESQVLAQNLSGHGLRLAFLCSCQTSVTDGDAFSGVGQQLLLPQGADLACVVASQANLPVRGSAQLSGYFYRLLDESGDPAKAISEARRLAFDRGGPAWSVPVLLTRPQPVEVTQIEDRPIAGIPPRRPTYLKRPEPEGELARAIAQHRLVSLVGLPGVGKTELGQEAARQALRNGLVSKVIYRSVHLGLEIKELRTLLGTALGVLEVPDDETLALIFESRQETLLLVLDNAEDLMRDDRDQTAFANWLDRLLTSTHRLRVLLTTRWRAETVVVGEHPVDVVPLTMEESDTLFQRELRVYHGWREDWPSSKAWKDLLELIDGHPRTLWLVSRHFAEGRVTPEEMRDRLSRHKADAILTPALIGRKDVYDRLEEDKEARLKSLVASMDLSFQVLAERHPEAVEAFVALSLFPGGLPEVVAKAVTGGEETLALNRLYHYHLVQWADERTFYPVPLHWYAERQRQDHPVDEPQVWKRATTGFADFAEFCHSLLSGGRIVDGIDRLAKDKPSLVRLTESLRSSKSPENGLSDVARLANAARDGLLYLDDYDLGRDLAEAGLRDARAVGDRAGEANCLQSLGDLLMRVDELDEARQSYEQALPIYKDIRARLGEANVRQALGLLELAEGRAASAFARFLELLAIYREIQERMGEQAALGYLARCAHAAGVPDQAIALAEASLQVGSQAQDRFGQTITLDLQISVWLAQDDHLPAVAAMILYRDLSREMKDARQMERFQPILDQVLPTLPDELRTTLEEQPDAVRRHAVGQALEKLKEAGVELFDPPPGD